ncbi:putative ankyrin repeat protein RF_0381 [Saccostrea cucullata]|uniref:putative ankyrin repeat protein RF_0381 n=1 Tax=Saccostrea cuccullata TaxID=36930 RepID=UPI002ED3D3FA
MCKYLVEHYPKLLHIIDNDGETVLLCAARKGNVELFQLMIDKGLDASIRDKSGKTVLHWWCRNGDIQMCEYLINKYPHFLHLKDVEDENVLHEAAYGGNVIIFKLVTGKGINVFSKTKKGKTVLHQCCMNGMLNMCLYLLKHYPDLVKIIDKEGETVLHDAAFGGNIDLLKCLIAKGLDEKSKTKKGKTVLHKCCMNGHLEMCKYLVKRYNDLVRSIDNDGETVLHDAAWGGNVALFRFLINKGLDINRKTNKGKTVLHKCCLNGHLEMCKYLVKRYSNLVGSIDFEGKTVLHDAAFRGNVALFQFLINKGLDVKSKTKKGKTVLHMCCMNGKLAICKYLVNNHPELVDLTDNDEETVIHSAGVGDNVDLLKLLIAKGLPTDSKTRKGKTVLHKCCMTGKIQMCKYLVNNYQQLLTVQDNDGFNALHDTAIGGEVEIFKFLLEKGLDVHSKTGTGQTVLHLSCHVGKHMDGHVDKQAMFDYLIDSYPDLLNVGDNEAYQIKVLCT